MTRIESTFATLKSQNKKALIPYVMAGDPNPSSFVGLLHDLVKHGADMIEVGLPFSDPMADGPTVALAGERALAAGTSTRDALNMVAEFRKQDTQTPIILMGYLNPVEIIGYDNFVQLCEQAGVDGILMVDLPPAEAGSFTQHLSEHAMNEIFLLSPTTLPERREQVLTHCGGMIEIFTFEVNLCAAYLIAQTLGVIQWCRTTDVIDQVVMILFPKGRIGFDFSIKRFKLF